MLLPILLSSAVLTRTPQSHPCCVCSRDECSLDSSIRARQPPAPVPSWGHLILLLAAACRRKPGELRPQFGPYAATGRGGDAWNRQRFASIVLSNFLFQQNLILEARGVLGTEKGILQRTSKTPAESPRFSENPTSPHPHHGGLPSTVTASSPPVTWRAL